MLRPPQFSQRIKRNRLTLLPPSCLSRECYHQWFGISAQYSSIHLTTRSEDLGFITLGVRRDEAKVGLRCFNQFLKAYVPSREPGKSFDWQSLRINDVEGSMMYRGDHGCQVTMNTTSTASSRTGFILVTDAQPVGLQL
jgi:hypothetical protein